MEEKKNKYTKTMFYADIANMRVRKVIVEFDKKMMF